MSINTRHLLPVCSLLLMIPALADAQEEQSSVTRGEYIYHLGGCASCHTNGKEGGAPLAGGLEMETPFGTFYTPNITPDPQYGIGNWSEDDFIRAMTEGVSPEGEHYYPAFPYTSYTKMSQQDLLDLKTFLDLQAPVAKPSKEHDLPFPLNQRFVLGVWKWLNFESGSFQINQHRNDRWNRGAYIVNGPGHCVECHTPRNIMGGLDTDAGMTGNDNGPEGEAVPGLQSSNHSEFSKWEIEDITFSLETGMKPDGDFLGGSMGHVIDNTTSKMTPADLEAIAEYLKSLN
ncbi:MAG: cytochrome c [Motiliproteus sp.]|nr:cytochrome c [Motiliproteus sp.]MCW9052804.1 cytochrome c [Motiliproteus sp.]